MEEIKEQESSIARWHMKHNFVVWRNWACARIFLRIIFTFGVMRIIRKHWDPNVLTAWMLVVLPNTVDSILVIFR